MSWDLAKLYAFLTWPPCATILFIASCRLNAMPRATRFPVVLEYAIWAGIAFLIPALPFIGEWPGLGVVILSYALATVLFCSKRAWQGADGDQAPAIATDIAPLAELPEIKP